jgi:hypothetical protein
MDKWNYSRNLRKISRNARWAKLAVSSSLAMAFGTSQWPMPWADKVLLAAVRCSMQRRRLDPDGVIGGLKGHVDALVASGLIIDDNYLRIKWGPVEDRIESMWRGLGGPATHLIIAKLNGRDELEAIDPILSLMGEGGNGP